MVGNELTLGVASGEMFIGADTATFVMLNTIVTDNVFSRLNIASPLIIEGTANTNTGVIARNIVASADSDAPTLADAGGLWRYAENYSAAIIDFSGRLIPAIEST